MFLIFLLVINTSQALTPEHVLKTAWDDKTYLVHDSIQATDSKNPFRNIEAYYTNEHDGATEVEVGLKFNLKSYAEWKTGRSRNDQSEILKESALSWALRDRYAVILNSNLNEKKLNIIDKSIETAERNLKALGLSLQAAKASSKNFLDAKEDLLRLQRSKAFLKEEKNIFEKRLQRWIPDKEPLIESFDIVDVEDVSKFLLENPLPTDSLTGKLTKEEIQQLDQELQIVKGRENQWFKSFDLSQAEKKKERFVEVGFTLILPPLGSDDLSKQRQNELILKKALKQKDLTNTLDQLQILRFRISNAIDIYRHSQSGIKLLSKAKSADPLVSLQTRLTEQRQELDLLNQQQNLLNLFLEYLVESEEISKQPKINYLSSTRKVIP